jgi:hypothetical protein
MGDLPKLQSLLDRLVALHRLAPAVRNLWLTEQGYATNAELRDHPWSEADQAQLNAESEYLAWKEPQVVSYSQFLLRDTLTGETLALRSRTKNPQAALAGTWTTGLLREGLQPKPGLWMFRSPVVARITPAPTLTPQPPIASSPQASASFLQLEVWGRARPVRAATKVEVEVSRSGRPFERIRETTTDASGIFDVPVFLPLDLGLRVRFRWRAPGGSWQASPATAPIVIPTSSLSHQAPFGARAVR